MNKETFVKEIESATGMLYRVAFTILRNDDACKDAIHDATLKAWEKRSTLREDRYFRTWITRILINTCYNTLKRRQRFIPLDSIPEPQVEPPDITLSLALQSIPDKLRIPFVLCYSEQMSYAEIAAVLHIPVSTVRGRIHRAKEALKKELDAE